METRLLGPTGERVPVIGLGTWRMENDDRAECIAALRRGLDLGLRHIDTAEMYGDGEVEILVGEAIAGHRDETFLASKVLPANASLRGTIAACERSLRRLRTDHLDLYLLHWPGPHPLADTLAAFEMLRKEGKIHHYGLSNFAVEELEVARLIVGEGKIACDQVLYHLKERAIEHAVLPWCEQHRAALVAYSPFGSGSFPSPRSVGGRLLRSIADAHSATPRQVALRFLTRRPSLFAIPKAARVEHVEEIAGTSRVHLDESDLALIDQAFPLGPPRPGVPMI